MISEEQKLFMENYLADANDELAAIQEAKRKASREALRKKLLPETPRVEGELMELRELASIAGRFLNSDAGTDYHQGAYKLLSEAYEAWCQNYRHPSSQAWVSGVGEVK